ncbi:MAG: hypothetical protein BIFFINMI_00544 [Phycisphaerae bacterium]|nr:hypothetical protein [Phycisphaerae bacterium]
MSANRTFSRACRPAMAGRLADDKVDGVAEQIKAIRADAAALADAADQAELKELADKLKTATTGADSGDLAKARAALKTLSPLLIELLDWTGPGDIDQRLYVVHCPMAKADWLQTGKAVANPYYGHDMLTCGSVVTTFGPVATSQPDSPQTPQSEVRP